MLSIALLASLQNIHKTCNTKTNLLFTDVQEPTPIITQTHTETLHKLEEEYVEPLRDKARQPFKASVSVQPHLPLEEEIIDLHDKERPFENKEIHSTYPTQSQIPFVGIQTTNEYVFETSLNLESENYSNKVAISTYVPSTTIQVTENIPNDTVQPLEIFSKMSRNDQKQQILESNALEISNIQCNEMELPLENITMSGQNATFNMQTSEHLVASETNSGESAEKFYPEVIVPTEVAHPIINSLKEYKTQITTATEMENSFVTPCKLSHQAHPSVVLQDHLTDTEIVVQENVKGIEEALNLHSETLAAFNVEEPNSVPETEQVSPSDSLTPLVNKVKSSILPQVTSDVHIALMVNEVTVLNSVTDDIEVSYDKANVTYTPNEAQEIADKKGKYQYFETFISCNKTLSPYTQTKHTHTTQRYINTH